MKIAIVISQFNKEISNALLDGAKACYEKNNFTLNPDLLVYEVPGAFEIPAIVKQLLNNNNDLDAIVTLGCIIKGETANFDLICSAITNGIMQISIDQKKPIGNAIITCFNKDQALNRLDKGKEAATAILEVLKIK